MKNTTSRNYLALSISLVLGTANIAYAQEVQTNPETPSAEAQQTKKESTLEVITVTSEKRVQNLQEVPVAISAFTADMLEARGIDTPQDLQFAVPGLSIAVQNNTGGTAKATIRGIGTENYQPGGDPGVPIHINGHYTQSTAYILRDMIDVERVEVQRGPQGTLYGRNAIGGNINIITNAPTDYFEGKVGFELGNYSKHNIHAVLSGPLAENVNARFVVVDEKRDGYVEDIGVVGNDRDTSNYTAVRGAIEFEPTDNLNVYINAYSFDDKGNSYARRLDFNPDNVANSDPWKVKTNTPSEETDKSKGASLDLSWSQDSVEFRSLTAYDDTRKTAVLDTDNTDTVNREFGFDLSYETLTQEFQLLSTNDSPLQWVLGAFYYKEESTIGFDIRFLADTNGNGISPPEDPTDPRALYQPSYYINATSKAIFGQLEYDITEDFQLVAGLRYTKDNKDRLGLLDFSFEDGSTGSVFGGVFVAPTVGEVLADRDDRSGTEWSEVTGKVGVNYFAMDDLMFYGSFSKGYKAGGYNTDQPDTYDPEYVDSFEFGFKSRWLDERVQANLSAFYYDYSEKQDFQRFVDEIGLDRFKILNASEATSKGLEVELSAYLSDALRVDGSFSYLDAEFNDFNTIDSIFPEDDPQRKGNSLPLSPELKFNIGAQYEWEIESGYLLFRADYAWVDEQYSNAFNRKSTGDVIAGTGDYIPSYKHINASLQWDGFDDVWSFELYISNLTDEYIITNSYVSTASEVYVSQMAPRTYGAKLSYRF